MEFFAPESLVVSAFLGSGAQDAKHDNPTAIIPTKFKGIARMGSSQEDGSNGHWPNVTKCLQSDLQTT